jgi:hypothetical protein
MKFFTPVLLFLPVCDSERHHSIISPYKSILSKDTMDTESESSDCSTTNQSEREEASPASPAIMYVSAIGLAMDNSIRAVSSESLADIVDAALEIIEDVTVQEDEEEIRGERQ